MYRAESTELNRYIAWGLLLSLAVHLCFAISVARTAKKPFDTPVFVDIVMENFPPPKEPAKRQIVSTPEITPSKDPPPDTRFESERDVAVAKEQIKRGDELAGPVVGKEGPPAPPQRASRPGERKPVPAEREPRPQHETDRPIERKLSPRDLKLDSETVRNQFAMNEPKREEANPLEEDRTAALSTYAPFSRPFGSGARFLGSRGNSDYIPNLPDGDITLLNTKANQYAVFVRRVATQVFAQMRTEGWDVLRGADIRSASEFAVVRAVLSPKGELLRVNLESSSGSMRFDKLLASSAQQGARDPNPPKGAQAFDGNIHFIFQARSWVDVAAAPRTGFPTERRWVLLGTGLE